MSTVRRVFFYVLALITLGILALGLWNLFSLAFDTILAQFTLAKVGDARPQLSLGIAMVVIGGPLWFLFWNTMLRQVTRDNDEAGSALRAFSLHIVLLVFSVIILVTLPVLLAWALGGFQAQRFNHGSAASFLVAVMVWLYYYRVSEKEGRNTPVSKTVQRWYVYGLSAAGLVCLWVGVVRLIDSAFATLPIWKGSLVGGGFWNNSTQNTIGWLLTGSLFWAFYWFYSARKDAGSALRQVYLYLLTIMGSAVAGLVALIITFYRSIYWGFGGDRDVVNYFQFLGWYVPMFLVAFGVWFYHLKLAQEESAEERLNQLSARRVHYYLMSFLGLGTLIAGLIMMLGIPLDLAVNSISQGTVIQPDWWYRNLSIGLSLLIVSIPIWLLYWGHIIGAPEGDGLNDVGARSRRIYLYGFTGAAVVMLAADLVNIVYQFLNGALTGNLGVEALRNSKWSLQTVLIAIPVLVYHLRLARQDQKLGSDTAAVRRKVIVMIADKKASAIAALEGKLGYKVKSVRYAGEGENTVPSLSEENIEQLVNRIKASPSEDVMVLLLEGRIDVLPYR